MIMAFARLDLSCVHEKLRLGYVECDRFQNVVGWVVRWTQLVVPVGMEGICVEAESFHLLLRD